MSNITYHSVILQGNRFKMAEGSAQMTNVQLVLDKLDREQSALTLLEAKRIRPGYAKHPVLSMLLNLIILGCTKKL